MNSLRSEGGILYLTPSHADAGLGLSDLLDRRARLDLHHRFTYFFQDERSHEESNRIERIDNGVRLCLAVSF